jgi:hypothetical protein
MKVIDNFVTENWLLDAIHSAMNSTDFSKGTMWYSGWWRAGAHSAWHELIREIWKEHPFITDSRGFEYWGNTLGDGFQRGLDLHKDKDEALRDRTGEIISPRLGAVYYPYQPVFDGGYLEVFDDDKLDRMERFAPKFNRLIVFDPSNYHRVTPVFGGYRFCFVVNVWRDHIPEALSTNDATKKAPESDSGGV